MKTILSLSAAILVSIPLLSNGQANPRPNVVVILADDQGWGDLSLHGNTNLSTPNLDSLARDGALFDRFFVCPVCSPTRAEFLTGRYHPQGGVYSTSTGGERLDLDERTIGDVFKEPLKIARVASVCSVSQEGDQSPGLCVVRLRDPVAPLADHGAGVGLDHLLNGK